ncbi:rho guanine nucleotide exchange factor 10-like protein isoform X1 [Leptopilina heterotoma]|uniref:rho guanine nucleotide exchange factor 10-like protein isoform X1 n=1 Tax=Leptopilina heterotoma TaxID=63436 RepID=UPI001CA99666|nr:rho guanine nucleotide exchange factor 10-like protein isoform X1 [Leptopilina heterotoma]XP_043483527.1 rho guanine nucleotide exchange factor 10-like protein isoform X1 [Leptopilina heterotoma]
MATISVEAGAEPMALEMSAGANLGTIPRRVNLEFPPPPTYPPPHNNHTNNCSNILVDNSCSNMSMIPTLPSGSRLRQYQDYSYAYYEPSTSAINNSYPMESTNPFIHQNIDNIDAYHNVSNPFSLDIANSYSGDNNQRRIYQQNHYQSNHYVTKEMNPQKRHTYVTRYGTEENIYEEISDLGRQCPRSIRGSRQSLVAEEVRRVQYRHRRVLGELNLSVEAMLMPKTIEGTESIAENPKDTSTDELLGNMSPTDQLLSPIACDLDSGFSGSSSASYRSGLGSLRRGVVNQRNNNYEANQRKTKAAMIWKKGWKKLQALGSNSEKQKNDEPRSRCRSWDDVGPIAMDTVSQHGRHQRLPMEPIGSNTSTRSARSEDSWCSASDHDLSSDEESEKSSVSIKSNCQLRNTIHKARTLCDKWRSQNMRISNPETLEQCSQGKILRWFSIRRGSPHQYDVDTSDTVSLTSPVKPPQMPQLSEVEEESGPLGQFQSIQQRRQVPPSLPPAPSNLTAQQLKRRYIIAAIVHSENSYVSTLQRLVNDYKKPLEVSSPPILSQSKIATLFHRLPEILQCHTLFRIALAECVRSWDKDEKLGDVFVASFSKAIVLDIYSDFINNFSVAMDLAKQESKRKTALADFFKVKQISAHDRLSFFGLMVKPVQRFPQFILFLQDLLKHTPHGHHDRMSLQLALTQLESLAEMLNERKREAEQFQAFKEMLRQVSGKLSHRPLSSSSRYLIREDDVTQLEFNQNGMITKSKRRRLLLLNDLVVCVSVASRATEDFSGNERLTLKWTHPVSEVEIQDTSASPTLSRLLTAGLNKGNSLRSDRSGESGQLGADGLCAEMNDLMHDYEVMSRVNDLVAQLKGTYDGMTLDTTKQLLQSIQSSIQQKDEVMVWADSCCLQLSTKQGQMYTFQTDNPLVKKDWITELRLAQLALDPNNSPSWEVPEQEQRPSTKMPLFVSSQPVYQSQHQTEVRCGCHYTTQNPKPTRRRGRHQSYLWICTGDDISSHVTVFSQSTTASTTSLKQIATFDLIETRIAAMEFVKGLPGETSGLLTDTVWMGTDSRKLLIYHAAEPEKHEEIGSYAVSGAVAEIKYHYDNVFVALNTGSLLMFRRQCDGSWQMREPLLVQLGNEPTSCLMPINSSVYAACGKKVWVLNALSGEVTKSFSVQHEHVGSVKLMAHSGVGLWVALRNSSTVCLYHTETFKHLQDINIASNVLRVIKSPENLNNNYHQASVTVTALLACKGLLWVGTNCGISLTIPLPRLEGVPIISGRVNISYHAHFGPITFLLAIQNRNNFNAEANQEAEEWTEERAWEEEEPPTPKEQKKNESVVKLRHQLAESPVMLRRKRGKSEFRGSKTLPRGLGSSGGSFLSNSTSSSQSSGENCDVYGLYGDLMYCKDYDNENPSGIDPVYETLRRSDPELAAIPSKVSTLDRRLQMKITRPRSLDLSNWSVDSHASSLYTSSGSEENLSLKAGRLSRNSSTASRNGPYDKEWKRGATTPKEEKTTPREEKGKSVRKERGKEEESRASGATNEKKGAGTMATPTAATAATATTKKKKSGKKTPNQDQPKRTVLTLMGGRGYVNWRQLNTQTEKNNHKSVNNYSKDPNSNDAHIVLWEMKL